MIKVLTSYNKGYSISEKGKLFSSCEKTAPLYFFEKNKVGYVTLKSNGLYRNFRIKHLVASAFLGADILKKNLTIININGDLTDNRSVNLKLLDGPTPRTYGFTDFQKEQVMQLFWGRNNNTDKDIATELDLSPAQVGVFIKHELDLHFSKIGD